MTITRRCAALATHFPVVLKYYHHHLRRSIATVTRHRAPHDDASMSKISEALAPYNGAAVDDPHEALRSIRRRVNGRFPRSTAPQTTVPQ